MNFRKSKGFTLIELLVVVSIISLLSSVVLASVKDARMKARDARRLADLRQISNALQLYLLDNGNVAPTAGGTNADHNGYGSSDGGSWLSFQTILSAYISKLPVDPLNGQTIPLASRNNFTAATTYRYYYRRLDNNTDSNCPGDPDCSKTSMYILDANFERRSQNGNPVSHFLGVEYLNIADGI